MFDGLNVKSGAVPLFYAHKNYRCHEAIDNKVGSVDRSVEKGSGKVRVYSDVGAGGHDVADADQKPELNGRRNRL